MILIGSPNFKLTGHIDDPTNVDYNLYGLFKQRTIVTGELLLTAYYKSYDTTANTFSNLVVNEYRTYNRDPLSIAQYRTQVSAWIMDDETTGATKTTVKYYSSDEAIQEGVDRRNNMIAFAKLALLNGLAGVVGVPLNQTYAFDLLTTVTIQLNYYSQGYCQPLRDAISASTRGYMGVCQQERITASTIVNSASSQTDSITINNIPFQYISSNTPTPYEIANGFISLITGTTATSVSNYVSCVPVNINNGIFDLESKIPGWPFTLSISKNVLTTEIYANNNTLKTSIINQLNF